MSTLEYLDPNGTVNFSLVSWKELNVWLSSLNGVPNLEELPKGINRGKVIAELERRRDKTNGNVLERGLGMFVNRGYGSDWRVYENEQHFTHLEELLIFQPREWRLQAREYMFRFQFNIDRVSKTSRMVTKWISSINKTVKINMVSPILVVLFHPDMSTSKRFSPLCFLQAYDAENPFPKLLQSRQINDADLKALMDDLSPVEYYLAFADSVDVYDRDRLLLIGQQCSFPRLVLMKEFDFGIVIGQRFAKHMIRAEVLNFFMQRMHQGDASPRQAPLCMIFAGPSGNGKTELAESLAKLLNKPGEDAYIKIDCGKLTHANELFGMSGAYQGAQEGSALNNFVLRLSQEPTTLGVVLLDEIEKACQDVIHGLYQVIDKGEWTNKKLESNKVQTETVPCQNIVFILTTNATDELICSSVKHSNEYYTATDDDEIEMLTSKLEKAVRKSLARTHPFTDAFIARVGKVVPFLPLAKGNEEDKPLMGEMLAIAKHMIDAETDKLASSGVMEVKQIMSTKTKHRMANIVVNDAVSEAGARSIQKCVNDQMGRKMNNMLCRKKGGISAGSSVRYSVNMDEKKIDFAVDEFGKGNDELPSDSAWMGDSFGLPSDDSECA